MKNAIRKFFRGLRRDYGRFLGTYRYSPAAERLARLRARRQDGEIIYVTNIEALDGDACIVRADGSDGRLMLYVNDYRTVHYGSMRLQYHAAPAKEMITFFGWYEYLCRPDTYLTVVGG